jgi:aspartyl-tRNA synthetase
MTCCKSDLTGKGFSDLKAITRITPESVIMVSGKIAIRQEDDFNPGIRTGTIELEAESYEVINHSQPLPFEIRKANKYLSSSD